MKKQKPSLVISARPQIMTAAKVEGSFSKLPLILRQRWWRETDNNTKPENASESLLEAIRAALAPLPRQGAAVTGAAPTVSVQVSSPRLQGATDKVERVVDTILFLRRRKYITETQFQAAEKVKSAHDVLTSSMGNAMDFERVRGPASSGGRPIAFIEAAELLSEVRKALLPREHVMVEMVCGEGYTIQACAKRIFRLGPQDKVSWSQRKICSDDLQSGLGALSALWYGAAGKPGKIRTHRPAGSRPTEMHEHEVMPEAQTVHATGRKVFRQGRAA